MNEFRHEHCLTYFQRYNFHNLPLLWLIWSPHFEFNLKHRGSFCFIYTLCDSFCTSFETGTKEKEYFFLNVGPPKEDIFLITFYGLYFSSDVINVTNFHMGLWGQLPFTASLLSLNPFLLLLVPVYNRWIYSQLLKFSTARGSCTGLVTVGPTKV